MTDEVVTPEVLAVVEPVADVTPEAPAVVETEEVVEDAADITPENPEPVATLPANINPFFTIFDDGEGFDVKAMPLQPVGVIVVVPGGVCFVPGVSVKAKADGSHAIQA